MQSVSLPEIWSYATLCLLTRKHYLVSCLFLYPISDQFILIYKAAHSFETGFFRWIDSRTKQVFVGTCPVSDVWSSINAEAAQSSHN